MSSRHLLKRREHLFYSIISAAGYDPLIAIFIIGLRGKKMNLDHPILGGPDTGSRTAKHCIQHSIERILMANLSLPHATGKCS
jgi:hypothetical protein